MNSTLCRTFKWRSFLPLKEFPLRRHISCVVVHNIDAHSGVSTGFKYRTTVFRYKSSERSSVGKTAKFMDENNESDELSSGHDVGRDDETDFSDGDLQHDGNKLGETNSRSEMDDARVKALNFPWLNGIEASNKVPVVEKSVPGPIKYFRTKKETFFQFDYRNVERVPIVYPDLEVLLQKIEIMLKNIEQEPYGTSRGVATLRNNIHALPDEAKVRVLSGKGSSAKVGNGYDKAIWVTSHQSLRKAMFNLLYERHAIITSGSTHNITKLSSKLLGRSLLGPETRVVIDHQLARDIIRELWMQGVSSKYNRFIKRHEERFVERNFLRYLKPKSEEAANMDWDTDLMLNSDEDLTRQKPSPTTPNRR